MVVCDRKIVKKFFHFCDDFSRKSACKSEKSSLQKKLLRKQRCNKSLWDFEITLYECAESRTFSKSYTVLALCMKLIKIIHSNETVYENLNFIQRETSLYDLSKIIHSLDRLRLCNNRQNCDQWSKFCHSVWKCKFAISDRKFALITQSFWSRLCTKFFRSVIVKNFYFRTE